MSQFARSPITAVLGPTNTGKTHLAVERMCGHASGMIGFPLRLLAREVYDRVVKMKGPEHVGLITGEEKILPPKARWLLCTAESMPLERDVAFVGLDEAQLGADPERGHVFTDRVLRARGREETMILGSESLKPMLKALVPDAEVIGRPRFSTLSYAGAKKLSRLPRRSAIVAFSAEEVYAVAEALRRLRGGAAVVMGALSPRTRNAQVAMFQAGEVDYLVATDAIGMGLNMDVAHVAFASLNKFDGRRQRRLTIAEMAQIAGRAGRHQRDGTFGALSEEGPSAFTPEEVLAIEGHQVPRLEHLFWRQGEPDFASIDALVASLQAKPEAEVLRAAPQAVDLAVLKRLAEEDWIRARVRSPRMVARLWAACSLPDFRKLGVDPHARFVGRVFGHISEGAGHLPHQWFADELQRLDHMGGDVEVLAGRIAAARSWAYIAHRADWLQDPTHWAERTRAVEEKLSDALHASLTQRFVDRRTTVLLRQIGADATDLPVTIGPEGGVSVEDHPLGTLSGFHFSVSPDARAADKRMLLAAAEKRLSSEYRRRGEALAEAPDTELSLSPVRPVPVDGQVSINLQAGAMNGGSKALNQTVFWGEVPVARLTAGTSIARPKIVLDRALDVLEARVRIAVQARLDQWFAAQLAKHLPVFAQLDVTLRDPHAGGPLRALAHALLDAGGLMPRRAAAHLVEALDGDARKRLRKLGVTIGTLDLFAPALLKPGAARWRRELMGLAEAPRDGASVLARGTPGADLPHGFRPLGPQAVRVDLVERIARAAHDSRQGRKPFTPDPALATSIGLNPETLARLMAQLGFRTARTQEGEPPRWIWQGLTPAAKPKAPPSNNAFAALAGLRDG
ncbi:helicase-related protein [Sphingomonas xinjiangensis]|uniref:ATP-dependent RNA helicase SUPV3L1/SUV3 n=1 Tax=Sphingomonas xinjiangensis TaxID=643568 RepID=A0A840YET3_9SPHN|nr:helicase-related protein [Sphingomonas xinjiangensis]MBB5711967.1 ATP-dependent RNA helicase SUPV3L1/SUV3 [Sphingomonas xinjiangensis]